MRILLSITLLCLAGSVFADAAPEGFDRYKVILDRKPFGDPPIAPEPEPPPKGPPAPPWADSYRLVSVTKVDGSDVRVGILDTKSNKALVLKVGEVQDGIELLSADVTEESAELSKGGETVTMNLKAAAAGSRPKPQAQPRPQTRQPANVQNNPRARPSVPNAPPPTAVPPSTGGQRSPRGVIRNRVPPAPPGR